MRFAKMVPATLEKMTEPEVWFLSITMQAVRWETFYTAELQESRQQRADIDHLGSGR